jgi:hypothetical protein
LILHHGALGFLLFCLDQMLLDGLLELLNELHVDGGVGGELNLGEIHEDPLEALFGAGVRLSSSRATFASHLGQAFRSFVGAPYSPRASLPGSLPNGPDVWPMRTHLASSIPATGVLGFWPRAISTPLLLAVSTSATHTGYCLGHQVLPFLFFFRA